MKSKFEGKTLRSENRVAKKKDGARHNDNNRMQCLLFIQVSSIFGTRVDATTNRMGIGASSTQSEVQKLLREITFENKAETLARLRELKASGAEGSGEMKYELMKRASALEVSTIKGHPSFAPHASRYSSWGPGH